MAAPLSRHKKFMAKLEVEISRTTWIHGQLNAIKGILRYSQYKIILNDYLSLPEFNDKVSEIIRGKRVAVTSLCNYVGITSFATGVPEALTGYFVTLSYLPS